MYCSIRTRTIAIGKKMDIEIWGCVSTSHFIAYDSNFCKGLIYYGEFLDVNNNIKVGIIVRCLS